MFSKSLKASASVAAAIGALAATTWSAPAVACSGTEPLLGSICIVPYNFAPRGYAFTNGQVMSIAQNTALFSLLGTTYGGNGVNTFALPDTRGRVIIGAGQGPGLSNYDLGQVGGTESTSLTIGNMPTHTHTASTTVTTTATVKGQSATGNADGPGGNTWAARPRGGQYSTLAPDVAMSAGSIEVASTGATTIGTAGNGIPFNITQPYVVLNYIIALEGIFPSRN